MPATTSVNADNPQNHSIRPQHLRAPSMAGNDTSHRSRFGQVLFENREARRVPGPVRSNRSFQTGKDARIRQPFVPTHPHTSRQTMNATTRGEQQILQREQALPFPSSSPTPSALPPQSQPLSPENATRSLHRYTDTRPTWRVLLANQREERTHKRSQDSMVPREHRAIDPSRATKAETTSMPSADDTEPNIINSYPPSSSDHEVQATSRPTSLNSQCSYALANEDDYVVEQEPCFEDSEWDRCNVSSAED